MKDLEIFDLLSDDSREVLKILNPKNRKIAKMQASSIRKALVKGEAEIEELFTQVGIAKNIRKSIQISNWLKYAYHEAFVNSAEKVSKGHLVFAFIILCDIEKYYQAKKILYTRAGLDVDTSAQSFVQDITEAAKKIQQPFIGREKEMTRLIVNLSAQNEDRPTLLLGESGTGKTSMVIELARRINAGLVPVNLLGARVLRIKFGMLLSLISMEKPGVQSDIFSKIMNDILSTSKYKGKVILFMDDLRLGSNFMISFSSVNKKAGISIVGAAQPDIMDKFWENPASKAWNIISLEDHKDKEIIDILEKYAELMQSKGSISYNKEAIAKILDLYKLGFIDEGMPGGGIKLLEQLAIYKRHRGYNYSNISEQIKNIGSKPATKKDSKELEKTLFEMLSMPVVITEKDVASFVDLDEGDGRQKEIFFDSNKLLNLEKSLKSEIIGQDDAIEALARTLRISSLKLTGDFRPVGAFLLLGPTGVGKTETAKALARYIFGFKDKNKRIPNNFYRADLSEFGEKHTVSRLFGAPPGYVGYEDSASLTDFVAENPTSIVLFDEIDKAHPDVLNSLLHIMDEGEIRNNKGEIVSFENVIILMTSNHGAELINKSEIGFNRASSEWRENVMDNLKSKLKPEFLNRFDEIILFNKLSDASVREITSLQLESLTKKLSNINVSFTYTKSTLDKLIKESNTEEYGVRELKRIIKKFIMDPISRKLLEDPKIKQIKFRGLNIIQSN